MKCLNEQRMLEVCHSKIISIGSKNCNQFRLKFKVHTFKVTLKRLKRDAKEYLIVGCCN